MGPALTSPFFTDFPVPASLSVRGRKRYDDLVLFLHAFTPLITFGLICNSFRFACFVNSSLRFLIPNLHPICTCSCLFTPLTEGRSARDLTQAATSQKKIVTARRIERMGRGSEPRMAEAIYNKTVKEVKAGTMSGPFTEEELNTKFGSLGGTGTLCPHLAFIKALTSKVPQSIDV